MKNLSLNDDDSFLNQVLIWKNKFKTIFSPQMPTVGQSIVN
jgi:hypothetical protein